MAQTLIALAAVMSLTSFLCFRRIRVRDHLAERRPDFQLNFFGNVRDAVGVLVRNGRFRRCVAACFAENFFGMLYLPLIWAFLSGTLGFGYLGCAVLMHALPAAVAFASTGFVGWRIDRSNPWVCWAWIRFAWGADALLLAATPLVAGDPCPDDARAARIGPDVARQRPGGMVGPLVADRSHTVRPARRRHQPLHGHHGLYSRGQQIAGLAGSDGFDRSVGTARRSVVGR